MGDQMVEKLARIESSTARTEAGVNEMQKSMQAMQTAMQSMEQTGRDTATASMRMATIAEERYKAEREEREARLRREEKQAEREAEMRGKFADWLSANWMYIGIVAMFLLNPASLGKMYELGMLAPLGLQPAPVVQSPAAPAPLPAPVVPPQESNR